MLRGCFRVRLLLARGNTAANDAIRAATDDFAPVRQNLGEVIELTILPIESQKTAQIRFTLNGEETDISFAPYKTLLEVLREDLGHTGTKHGCELGECGACAVLLDGKAVLSCLVLALECSGKHVLTVEGLGEDGNLHPLQDAFADLGAAQCGYCTPAILVTVKALLDHNPHPTRDQIREAISGNLCRCTGYLQIFEAVEAAVLKIAEQKNSGV
jgi:carbon-monoxide dehydrogenase small subunit